MSELIDRLLPFLDKAHNAGAVVSNAALTGAEGVRVEGTVMQQMETEE